MRIANPSSSWTTSIALLSKNVSQYDFFKHKRLAAPWSTSSIRVSASFKARKKLDNLHVGRFELTKIASPWRCAVQKVEGGGSKHGAFARTNTNETRCPLRNNEETTQWTGSK
jgi:hypothetical protein